MTIEVKICGLRDQASLNAAIEGGAAFVGFVFYAKSKNAITLDDARQLAALVPAHIVKTGMFVDADDNELQAVTKAVPLDLLQLHGNETPGRIAEIRALTGLPAMKALRLTKPEHLRAIPTYEAVADRLLFDSRIGNEPSGGPIDWNLLKGRVFKKVWLLAGGLNAKNLAEAVRASGATAVDVSSGVEDASGHKSPDKIREFLAVAAQL
jgi:phosphoribosylanthranilate isomerase